MPLETPSQTVGPFFHMGLARAGENVLAGDHVDGERVRIEGRVVDGAGDPVDDALVELWQANADGRYRHPADDREDLPLDPHFTGFGRAGTNANGEFWFTTVKPGAVPARGGGWQAPHCNLQVFARGLLRHLSTRLYFADDPATTDDPVLASVPEARRTTLLARPAGRRDGLPAYRFDIILQGDGETVCFDV